MSRDVNKWGSYMPAGGPPTTPSHPAPCHPSSWPWPCTPGRDRRLFSGSKQTLTPFKTSSKLELSVGLTAMAGWGAPSPLGDEEKPSICSAPGYRQQPPSPLLQGRQKHPSILGAGPGSPCPSPRACFPVSKMGWLKSMMGQLSPRPPLLF